jgi:membrane-bound serine protease (ClpP class)
MAGWLLALLSGLALAGLCAAAPPQQMSVPAWRAAPKAAIITLHGEVDAVTRASILRRLKQAQADGAGAVVIELDTPGGDLSSTLDICLAIKDETQVPVYAWVHPRAFSAGTILALACRGILVSPNAVFGDAAPIQALPGLGLSPLPAAERAKIEAPVLAEVVDSARRNGYDEALVRAFITVQEEVWMLRNTKTDQRIFVGRPEYKAIFGQDPPVTRGSGTAMVSARTPLDGEYNVLPAYDDRFRKPDQPTAADVAEREEYVDFLQVRKPTREPLTSADRQDWELVAQVDGAEELLVVYAPEARAFALAQEIASSDAEIAAYFGANQITRYDEHWGDAMVRFLTSWPVRLVLVIVLLVGFLVEIAAPGVGWFGGAATMALVLLLGAPLLAGIQSWWPVLLVLAGVLLVVIEVFITPGFGVLGFLGAGCVAVGLVAAFVQAPLNTPEGQNDLTNALAVVVGGGIISGVCAWWVVRALPKSKFARGAVLYATTGDISAVHAQARPIVAIGQVGTVITPLRPVGKADFGGRLIEVQSVGDYISEGRKVVVTSSSAYAVEVEEQAS